MCKSQKVLSYYVLDNVLYGLLLAVSWSVSVSAVKHPLLAEENLLSTVLTFRKFSLSAGNTHTWIVDNLWVKTTCANYDIVLGVFLCVCVGGGSMKIFILLAEFNITMELQFSRFSIVVRTSEQHSYIFF